ncbi:MAG: cupredoxin domain-containing protein [Verrucomicrobia bacterium]|nr:cupredoxin domain-containing protein [Verrucomicrobiota bacterium]
MKTHDPVTNLHRQEVHSPATEDVQNVPSSIHRQKHESRAGRRRLRLWLFSICALAIIIVGAFLVRSRGSGGTGNGSAPANTLAPAVAASVTQVSMRNLQYYPATIEVKKGDVVEWKNDDLVPHTATAASFDSGTIASGQSWRHTFTDAGNFPYVCTFHPQMKGIVIVK